MFRGSLIHIWACSKIINQKSFCVLKQVAQKAMVTHLRAIINYRDILDAHPQSRGQTWLKVKLIQAYWYYACHHYQQV